MQKALANGRVSFLLAAVLTVTQTRRKRNWSPCSGKSSTSMPGLPATLNLRPSSAPDLCPVRRAGTPGQAVKASLVSPGWCRQDQAVTGQLMSG